MRILHRSEFRIFTWHLIVVAIILKPKKTPLLAFLVIFFGLIVRPLAHRSCQLVRSSEDHASQ